MPNRSKENPNFLEALAGLIFAPGETVDVLLDTEPPPYGPTICLCLLLSIFVPILAQYAKYGMTIYNTDAVFALLLILFFSILFFALFEALFLKLLGADFPITSLLSAIFYCMAPVLLAIWLVYAFNYYTVGRISVLNLILMDSWPSGDVFLRVMPIVLGVVQLNLFLVFFYSVKKLCQMYSTTAFFVTLISLVIFWGSVMLSLLIAEMANTGTIRTFFKVVSSPSSLTAFY